MNRCTELPSGYEQIHRIDLQKNRKLALLLNCLALLVSIVMVAFPILFSSAPSFPETMVWIPPTSTTENIFFLTSIKWVIVSVGIILYVVLHEWTHGFWMSRFSTLPVQYGFTTLYAYAGSNAYFNKKHYIIIALAPTVVWGIVLTILTILVPPSFFWVVYLVQVTNISGGMGDLYVTAKVLFLPKEILVQDDGTAMTIYAPQQDSQKAL